MQKILLTGFMIMTFISSVRAESVSGATGYKGVPYIVEGVKVAPKQAVKMATVDELVLKSTKVEVAPEVPVAKHAPEPVVEEVIKEEVKSNSDHNFIFGLGSTGASIAFAYKYDNDSHWRFRVEHLVLNESLLNEVLTEEDRTFEIETNGITTDAVITGDIAFTGALIDFYPFTSFFRLSVGAYKSNVLFNGLTQYSDAETINIDGTDYDVVGTVDVKAGIEWDAFAPYAGIGFDIYPLSWLGINIDIGAFYIGAPDINMTYRGTVNDGSDIDINDIPELTNEVNAKVAEWEDEFKRVNIYPQVRAGVAIRF